MNVVSLLQTAATQGSLLGMIAPFALIFVIFYFFIIRPQNKKQKETQKMISAVKKGDKIVTIGGIHGVVSSTKEQSVIVKVDDGAKIEFSRSAISSVVNDAVDKSATKKDVATKKDAVAEKDVVAEKPARTSRWKKGVEAADSAETTDAEEKSSDETTK